MAKSPISAKINHIEQYPFKGLQKMVLAIGILIVGKLICLDTTLCWPLAIANLNVIVKCVLYYGTTLAHLLP